MREVDRFNVRTQDGRTWAVAQMVAVATFQPLKGPVQHLDGATSFVLLDDEGGRYDITPSGSSFAILDLRSDAADMPAERI